MVITNTGVNVTLGNAEGFLQRFSRRRRLLHLRGDQYSAFSHGGFRSSARFISLQAGDFQYPDVCCRECGQRRHQRKYYGIGWKHPGECFFVRISGRFHIFKRRQTSTSRRQPFNCPRISISAHLSAMCRAFPEHSILQPAWCREKGSRQSTSEIPRPPARSKWSRARSLMRHR